MNFAFRSFAGLAAATAISWGAAAASVVTTFEFDGATTVNGTTTNLGPAFPAGNVFRDNGDGGNATVVGQGTDNPDFIFANGATAVGEARASSSTRISIDITNDESVARTAAWDFLIFGGGTGIIVPDLRSSGCSVTAIDICDNFFAPGNSHSASAMLEFSVLLDGVELFGGDIFVDANGNTINFNNIALNGFGPSAGNSQYFSWQETSFSQDLGVFAGGETKTLEFLVTATVISSGQDGCFVSDEFLVCTGATAGFGDPGGMNGGVIMRAFSLQSGAPGAGVTFGEIPVPAGIWLFLTAIGGALGVRKLRARAH